MARGSPSPGNKPGENLANTLGIEWKSRPAVEEYSIGMAIFDALRNATSGREPSRVEVGQELQVFTGFRCAEATGCGEDIQASASFLGRIFRVPAFLVLAFGVIRERDRA
jgi:hypothetical protein